jgi:hypothetical protein
VSGSTFGKAGVFRVRLASAGRDHLDRAIGSIETDHAIGRIASAGRDHLDRAIDSI